MTDKEKLIEDFFNRGILVNPDLLDKEINSSLFEKINSEEDMVVLNNDYVDVISKSKNLIDWSDLDQYRVKAEKERDDDLYQTQLQTFRQSTLSIAPPPELNYTFSSPTNSSTSHLSQEQHLSSLETELEENTASFTTKQAVVELASSIILPSPTYTLQHSQAVNIIISYNNKPHKYTVEDFAQFFNTRYKFLENILRHRQELQNVTTINRVLSKKDKEEVSIIGLVDEIGETKNGNLIITLEDLTGKIKVVIGKTKKELFAAAKELVVDEVIGISGVCGDKIIFLQNIIWPDIPNDHELKKGEDDEYIIFLSDIHVGSKLFLKDEFEKFIRWINSEVGNEAQRVIAKKVKYIIIAGDLVDGVGIYPSQEEELEINDIKGQYAEFTRLIRQIPTDKSIIMCPGNHDMVYLAEPQPVFYQEFAPDLFNLPNVILVTNPSLVNIGKTNTFSGFDVLLYHGYSFDYYVANVESIRSGGGYHRSDLIMKFLLKRRHLAPSFRSTPYFPAHIEDPLLIKKVPDFLITGHIHYSSVANYRGVTMISGSCWQAKTGFQEKLGHEPEPARVPIVNLKTREIKVLRFG